MAERVKLERIPIYPREYTTGDAQDWTYEYTLEDYYATFNHQPTSMPIITHLSQLIANIKNYFEEHPEKLIEDGPLNGYKRENLIRICGGGLVGIGVMSSIKALKKAHEAKV